MIRRSRCQPFCRKLAGDSSAAVHRDTTDAERRANQQRSKLVKLLQQAARQKNWTTNLHARPDLRSLLRELRSVKEQTRREAEQARYKDATDGAFDEREALQGAD